MPAALKAPRAPCGIEVGPSQGHQEPWKARVGVTGMKEAEAGISREAASGLRSREGVSRRIPWRPS